MKETQFKQTEIGLVPQEWRVVRLGEIGTFFSNNTLSRDYLSEEGTIRNIHYGDVLIKYGAILDLLNDDTPFINDTLLPRYEPMNIAKDGDIVIADTAEDETVCKVTELYNIGLQLVVAGLHTMWFRPKPKTFASKFLGYYLNASVWHNQILPLIQGIKVSSVSKNAIKETLLSLPPLSEQSRIAGALSSVDGLLSSLSRLIDKKRALRTAAMQQLLNAKTRLPGFNEPWKEVRLGDYASIKTGKRNGDEAISNGLYPFFVRSQEVYRINSYSYDGEAIIVPGEGDIGSIFHYINGKFDFHQRVYKISDFPKEINAKFLFFMMKRYFGPWALSQTVKATVDSLRLPTFENFHFPLPPLSEQRAIASVLSSMDSELSALEAKRTKVEALRAGMMQQLLTGRIRLTEGDSERK